LPYDPIMKLLCAVLGVVMAGCSGGGFARVPAKDWQALPTAKRDATDASTRQALVTAGTEVSAATAALANAQKALDADAAKRAKKAQPATTQAAASADPDAMQQQVAADQQAKARVSIEDANRTQLEAVVAWRQARLDAAQAHLDVVLARREFDHALAIDRSLNADQTYDVDPYRGQYASTQERWYTAETRSTEAQQKVAQASRDLAAAKDTLAQMVRVHEPTLAKVASAPMVLSTWQQASYGKRKGFRLIAASPTPCKRGKCFRQSETVYLRIAKH
jgi:hypothetical protein